MPHVWRRGPDTRVVLDIVLGVEPTDSIYELRLRDDTRPGLDGARVRHLHTRLELACASASATAMECVVDRLARVDAAA